MEHKTIIEPENKKHIIDIHAKLVQFKTQKKCNDIENGQFDNSCIKLST